MQHPHFRTPQTVNYDLLGCMDTPRAALPKDITALKEALATERAKTLEIAAELAVARAKAGGRQRADRPAEASDRQAETSDRRAKIGAFVSADRPVRA